MRVKTIIDEDFTNYKETSMFIGTISCGGKCCKEANIPLSVCQNDSWRKANIIDIPDEKIVERYLNNNLTSAIVIGGLEPFEQFNELWDFIHLFRSKSIDPIVIYTGYNEDEISNEIKILSNYINIIVKFGRYIPNSKSIKDEILGVTLASENQYARVL